MMSDRDPTLHRRPSLVWYVVLCAFAIALVVRLFWLFGHSGQPDTTASPMGEPISQGLSLPDWIQALSSIVAIAVAIGLALNERRISRQERAHDAALAQSEKRERRRLLRLSIRLQINEYGANARDVMETIKAFDFAGRPFGVFSQFNLMLNLCEAHLQHQLDTQALVQAELPAHLHVDALAIAALTNTVWRQNLSLRSRYPARTAEEMHAAIGFNDHPSINFAKEIRDDTVAKLQHIFEACRTLVRAIGALEAIP